MSIGTEANTKATSRPMLSSYKWMAAFLFASMLLAVLSVADGAPAPVDAYVSSPANIVSFQNYSTPQIEPGHHGYLEFRVVNRYTNYMASVNITIEITAGVNEKESKDISKASHPPRLEAVGRPATGQGTHKVSVSIPALAPGEAKAVTLKYKVQSFEDTYEATYIVRSMIDFWYGNQTEPQVHYIMKSKGYFTNEQWTVATSGGGFQYTNVNLTALNISGITPDTTFGVRSPFPQWPKWVFLGGAILFLGLGLLFVAMDNYGKFPHLKAWLDEVGRRKRPVRWDDVQVEEAPKLKKGARTKNLPWKDEVEEEEAAEDEDKYSKKKRPKSKAAAARKNKR